MYTSKQSGWEYRIVKCQEFIKALHQCCKYDAEYPCGFGVLIDNCVNADGISNIYLMYILSN